VELTTPPDYDIFYFKLSDLCGQLHSFFCIMRIVLLMSVIMLKGNFLAAQAHPDQPLTGPGGSEYIHQSVRFYDFAARADGYWVFEPNDPKPESAPVVVFLHGYGAYNPMCYGKWMKHLVAKGNIVIYPRYQRNLVFPRPNGFPPNAAKGIRDAIRELETGDHVRPNLDKVTYIGHSYGGITAAYLGANWQRHGVPKPAAMLLCEPGTGPFKGAILDSYANLPADLNLLIVVGEDDYVVGGELGARVFRTAVHTPNRNFIIQRRDTTHALRPVWASHSEPYCYDLDFDNGVRNYTAHRVFNTSRLDEVDFYCYWKLADALMDYTRHGTNGHVAFGNTPEQRFMGRWPDGRLIRELDVFLPQNIAPATGIPRSVYSKK
jgi:pimeloyl-ACP methyl ester carboxylesterase